MTTREKINRVIEYFNAVNPHPETELVYRNPYELAVAVILSAQCTDKRVNAITPSFFKRFPDVYALAEATVEEIHSFIKSCSYPNNKARHLKAMASTLVNKYAGQLPSDAAEMQKIPGIGRKTAHVLASVLFHQPTLAVDTHVFRVSARLGLTRKARTPVDCEKQLMRYLPLSFVHQFHHWLILHGRYICRARKPHCEMCGLVSLCSYFRQQKKDKSASGKGR